MFGALCQPFYKPRWDKYESKTMYWVEEDVEAEWESSKSKTYRERTQYETQTGAADALADQDVPLTLNMGDVRNPASGREMGGYLGYLINGIFLEHIRYLTHFLPLFLDEGFLAKMLPKSPVDLPLPRSKSCHKFRRTRKPLL